MRRFRMSFALARLGCGDQFMMGPLLQICIYNLDIRVYKMSTWDSVKTLDDAEEDEQIIRSFHLVTLPKHRLHWEEEAASMAYHQGQPREAIPSHQGP